MNALVTPTQPFALPEREQPRGRRDPRAPCARPLIKCRKCADQIMVITAPHGVMRVDPDPCEGGNLVLNGDALIAILPPSCTSRTWSGLAYTEHRCRAR